MVSAAVPQLSIPSVNRLAVENITETADSARIPIEGNIELVIHYFLCSKLNLCLEIQKYNFLAHQLQLYHHSYLMWASLVQKTYWKLRNTQDSLLEMTETPECVCKIIIVTFVLLIDISAGPFTDPPAVGITKPPNSHFKDVFSSGTEEVSSFEVEDLLSHDAPPPNESADSSASPSGVIRIYLSLLKDRLSREMLGNALPQCYLQGQFGSVLRIHTL